jgi:hypothetical protein
MLCIRFGDGAVAPVVGSAFNDSEHAHGEVVLSYTATAAGNYSMVVTVDGEPFGEVQEISVVAGPLALAAIPANADTVGVSAGGAPLHLQATAVDAFGNVRGEDSLELELRLSSAPPEHLEPIITLTHRPGDGTAELTVRGVPPSGVGRCIACLCQVVGFDTLLEFQHCRWH